MRGLSKLSIKKLINLRKIIPHTAGLFFSQISNEVKIFAKAKPGAKEEKIEKTDETHFIISVKEPPVQGRANTAIIRVLGNYFGVAPTKIKIISGYTSRQKIVEIKE